MSFEIIDMASWGSGEPNEDCVGHAAAMAWVIDGATDLVDAPFVGAVSDAAWLAQTAHRKLTEIAVNPPELFSDVPHRLNQQLAVAFEESAVRMPEERWAYPSATALIVRARPGFLDWVGLGDCAMIIESGDNFTTIGIGGAEAGDRSTAAEVARLQKLHGVGSEAERRARIWPRVRKERAARLNRPGGNASLSITPTPAELIATGSIAVEPGTSALLATDGLIRIIDIYARYNARTLFDAAKSRGIQALLGELREIENEDVDCTRHPRIKQSDDATGLLLRFD